MLPEQCLLASSRQEAHADTVVVDTAFAVEIVSVVTFPVLTGTVVAFATSVVVITVATLVVVVVVVVVAAGDMHTQLPLLEANKAPALHNKNPLRPSQP